MNSMMRLDQHDFSLFLLFYVSWYGCIIPLLKSKVLHLFIQARDGNNGLSGCPRTSDLVTTYNLTPICIRETHAAEQLRFV